MEHHLLLLMQLIGVYPIIYWLLYIPGGGAGFLPSTVLSTFGSYPKIIARNLPQNRPRQLLWGLGSLEISGLYGESEGFLKLQSRADQPLHS